MLPTPPSLDLVPISVRRFVSRDSLSREAVAATTIRCLVQSGGPASLSPCSRRAIGVKYGLWGKLESPLHS